MTDVLTEDALFELLSLEFRIDREGTVYYFNSLGQLHRIHGPAVVCTDGYHAWYQNGQRHRLDGPAIVYPSGRREWWLNGKELTEAEWQQQVASMQ